MEYFVVLNVFNYHKNGSVDIKRIFTEQDDATDYANDLSIEEFDESFRLEYQDVKDWGVSFFSNGSDRNIIEIYSGI